MFICNVSTFRFLFEKDKIHLTLQYIAISKQKQKYKADRHIIQRSRSKVLSLVQQKK